MNNNLKCLYRCMLYSCFNLSKNYWRDWYVVELHKDTNEL